MPSSRSSDLSMPLATDRPPGLPRPVPAPPVAVADSHHAHIHAHIRGIAAVDFVVLDHSGSHRVAVGPVVHHSWFASQCCHLLHRRHCYCRYRNTFHRQRNRHAHPLVLLPKTLGGAFRRLHVAVVIFDRAAHFVLVFFATAASSVIPTPKKILHEMAGPRLLLLMLLQSRRRGLQVQAM